MVEKKTVVQMLGVDVEIDVLTLGVTTKCNGVEAVISWVLLRESATQADKDLSAAYTELRSVARQLFAERKLKWRLEHFHACSGHVGTAVTGPWPYRSGITTLENPAAHGGVSFTAHCACGAKRFENSNHNHVETGPWFFDEREAISDANAMTEGK